jgi:ribosome-binding ATPase
MSIQAGLVGLPNVGKSTLFNALTKSQVPAENYPFCTIDPHMAITNVPDPRLSILKSLYKSEKIIPSTVNFVDIAGLVKGAASGEGLGNQFLSHIREVDLILHIVRCFEDPNITHSGDTIDPMADYEIIISELLLKDLESIDKRLPKLEKPLKYGSPQEKKLAEQEINLLQEVRKAIDVADAETVKILMQNNAIPTIPLLTNKNFLIIANLAENEIGNNDYVKNKHYQELVKHFGEKRVIPVSARLEYELSQLNTDEADEMMGMLGLNASGLELIIQKTYKELGLITFFTCGPREIHAWPIKKNTPAVIAAGEIHSDLQKGFICAEIFSYNDLIELKNEHQIKESGKMRREGKEYVIQDGDIVHIKFNV